MESWLTHNKHAHHNESSIYCLSLRLVASKSNNELLQLNGYESWLQNLICKVIKGSKVQIKGEQKWKDVSFSQSEVSVKSNCVWIWIFSLLGTIDHAGHSKWLKCQICVNLSIWSVKKPLYHKVDFIADSIPF